MTEHDQKLIDEACREMSAKEDLYFKRHGIDDAAKKEAATAYAEWVKAESKASFSLAHTPLARKAFIVGWFLSRKEKKL